MTGLTRLQVGGWAALLFLVLTLARLATAFAGTSDSAAQASGMNIAIDMLRLAAGLVAVIGLDSLYRHLAGWLGLIALASGLAASIAAAVATVANYLRTETAPEPATGLLLMASVSLWGVWLFIGGLLIARVAGHRRLGLAARLGGVGYLISAASFAAPLSGAPGPGDTLALLLRLGALLILFEWVFLVWIWRVTAAAGTLGAEPI